MSDIIGIRNLETDPHALRGRYQWGGKTVKREDGHYMYVGMGNSYMGSCTQNLAMSAPVGHVIALIAQTDDSSFAKSQIWYADELLAMQDGDVYIKAARIKEPNRIHEMTISQCSSGVIILGTALYTPEDWEHLYTLYQRGALPYPWFAGDGTSV